MIREKEVEYTKKSKREISKDEEERKAGYTWKRKGR
jgi:hypothetical protein